MELSSHLYGAYQHTGANECVLKLEMALCHFRCYTGLDPAYLARRTQALYRMLDAVGLLQGEFFVELREWRM